MAYDTGPEVWELLRNIYPSLNNQASRNRELVNIMMDPDNDDHRQARSFLQMILGVDPMYEVAWARAVVDNPRLAEQDQRYEARLVLWNAWFNPHRTREEKVFDREAFERLLGRPPFRGGDRPSMGLGNTTVNVYCPECDTPFPIEPNVAWVHCPSCGAHFPPYEEGEIVVDEPDDVEEYYDSLSELLSANNLQSLPNESAQE